MDVSRKKYVIGFTVHDAREMTENGVSVDPLVVVRACGREYKTQLKRNKSAYAKFEESFIWSDISMGASEFNMATLDFELQGACSFTRNDVLGIAKVQLAMVRKRRNHSYNLKVIRLSIGSVITSKLRVSIFCYGEGDEPPRPDDEGDGDSDDDGKAALEDVNNAAVTGARGGTDVTVSTRYLLFVHVLRVCDLCGGGSKHNVVVEIEFNGSSVELPKIKNVNSFSNDTSFRIPVVTPIFADAIQIRVWDKKGKPKLLLQGRLSFAILRIHGLRSKWFNFYGWDPEEVPDARALTNTSENVKPNTYRGRMLMSGRVQKVESAKHFGVAGLAKAGTETEPPSANYYIAIDVFEVVGCPGSNAYVTVSIGSAQTSTEPVSKFEDDDPSDDPLNSSRFSFRQGEGRIKTWHHLCPTEAEHQLDLLVSVWVDGLSTITGKTGFQRIGFKRLKLSSIRIWDDNVKTPEWITLDPLAHLPAYLEPGSILWSAYSSLKAITKRPVMNIKGMKFELRAYCMMARDLTVHNRVPNPLCQLACSGSVATTLAKNGTATPVWNEVLRFPLTMPMTRETRKIYPEPIQVMIYDIEHFKDGVSGKKTATQKTDPGQVLNNLVQGVSAAVYTGDIMANKRRNEFMEGRALIGRTQVKLRNLLRKEDAGKKCKLKLQWVKLKGGALGNVHVGDILLAFELTKKKYSTELPIKNTVPPTRSCTLTVALLGLRNIMSDADEEVKLPKVQIIGPTTLDAQPPHLVIPFNKTSKSSKSADDLNRTWHFNGAYGYDFFEVCHLSVKLPKLPTFEPGLEFRLFNLSDKVEKTIPRSVGRFRIADQIPWVDHQKAVRSVTAHEEYGSDDEENAVNGIAVSDDEKDDEQDEYMKVEAKCPKKQIQFDSSDVSVFPPVLKGVSKKTDCSKAGVKVGDWLVGFQETGNELVRLTGMWTGARAQEFVNEQGDGSVTLLFRRKHRLEVSKLLTDHDGKIGLRLRENGSPPETEFDTSPDKRWTALGVALGWYIVDINGVDTRDMNSSDNKFIKLMRMPKVHITLRTFARPGATILNLEDIEEQMKHRILLSGVSSAVKLATDGKIYFCWGDLSYSGFRLPRAHIPAVNKPTEMNERVSKIGMIDILGRVTKLTSKTNSENDRSRPSVAGILEEFIDKPIFHSVPLMRGGESRGILKMAMKLVYPEDENWVKKIKDSRAMDVQLFEESFFRERYKNQQPPSLRVRSYIIRGLNVSGASSSGYGNPYLYFHAGSQTAALEGTVQSNNCEPRFFRTDERDLDFPQEALLEVGLMDKQGVEDDPVIGSTFIDLEDRWYNKSYQDFIKANQVPVEYRPMMVPASQICKGSLEMWIETLDPASASEIPVSNLYQPPPTEVEIRVIIMDVKDISHKMCVDDVGEELSQIDVFMRCSLECGAYKGPHPTEQATDCHRSAEDEAEYNWRCVWPQVQVTKGSNLDCFLQIALWENAAFEPKGLCETIIDLKHYCQKASSQQSFFEIESEIKLFSNAEPDEADDVLNLVGMFDDDATAEQEAPAAEKVIERIGAIVSVTVQVIPQTEASMPEIKAGLGRESPNQCPSLQFPKTGRDWKSTLPTAAAAIEALIEGVSDTKRRCCYILVALLVIMIIVALHGENAKTGCPYVMKSCRTTCESCQFCHHVDASKGAYKKFCYYPFKSSSSACKGIATACNMKDSCDCTKGANDACDAETTCIRPPTTIPVTGGR